MMGPLVWKADVILGGVLGPLRVPRNPLTLARFGLDAIRPATSVARRRFREPRARALFAGLAAHSMLPLTRSPSAGVGLVLALLGHHVGWPFARSGSQAIADALASYLRSLGGEIRDRTERRIARRPPGDSCRPRRRHASPARPDGREAASRRISATPRRLPVRAGRLQARPGARRPDPVAGRGVRTRRDRSSRRDTRGDRRVRGGDIQRV